MHTQITHIQITHTQITTRRPSVPMMVCAVRLGTDKMRSRKERPSPHFLVSGIFAHDHTPQGHTHIHTCIQHTRTHKHERTQNTRTHTPDTHTHRQITHTHISLRHNSRHTYIHNHTHIHKYVHSPTHTHIPNSSSSSLLAVLSSLHVNFSFIFLWEKLSCGVIRSSNLSCCVDMCDMCRH